MKSIIRNTCLFLGLSAPIFGLGLGIRLPDQDAVATGRGNAFTATADNASAIYYNPAGLTQLEGWETRVGVYGIRLRSEYEGAGGVDFDTEQDTSVVPQLYASYTYRGDKGPALAFGLGVYAPYGLSLEWNDNPVFRAAKGELEFMDINPVVALQVHRTLSVAVGVNLNKANIGLEQTALPAFLFPPGGLIRFRGDGSSVSFNAGALWKPHSQHSFGVSYRSATKIDFSGSLASMVPVGAGRGNVTVPFQFPQQIQAGWSYRPTPKWNLEVNVDWTDWDQLNALNFQQSVLELNWKSSFMYLFGVTRYLPRHWEVSAGYIYSENSVPDEGFIPIVPDSNRHVFSLGVGKRYENSPLSWALAYQYAFGPERDVTGNQLNFPLGGSADGSYRFTSHALALTLNCAF